MEDIVLCFCEMPFPNCQIMYDTPDVTINNWRAVD